MARTISIGAQDFVTLREEKCFYIDKTGFLTDWWKSKDDVTLITRPRRFGKTLNLRTAEAFFSMIGIYPIGSIVKLFNGTPAVVVKKFKNFFEKSEILVLDKNLLISERKTVTAEDILDVPDAAGAVLPEKTIVQILNTFLDERRLQNADK